MREIVLDSCLPEAVRVADAFGLALRVALGCNSLAKCGKCGRPVMVYYPEVPGGPLISFCTECNLVMHGVVEPV